MLDASEARILESIGPGDLVLDVGGWARCFNRANYVIDYAPHESRGRWYLENGNLAAQGGAVEHFTAETWIQRDICAREPWPFPDKFFDFCTCSHTLEDIRDPLWVCAEMSRVARRGYVEVPSMLLEMARGFDPGVPVGLAHHRWIIDIQDHEIQFMCKFHSIHSDPSYNLPARVWRDIPDDRRSICLFWEGGISCRETQIWPAMAEQVRLTNPAGLRDEEETDRLQADLAEARREIEGLRERLRLFDGVGATGLKVARRIRRVSARYPGLTALLRRRSNAA